MRGWLYGLRVYIPSLKALGPYFTLEAKNGRRADSVFSLLGIPLVSFKSSVSSDPCRFKSKTHWAREGHATHKIPHKMDEDLAPHSVLWRPYNESSLVLSGILQSAFHEHIYL